MNIRFTTIIFLISTFSFNLLYGQKVDGSDSLKTVKQKSNIFKKVYNYFDNSNKVNDSKVLDISFVIGPNYSKDTKFGAGFVASGLYRLDKQDLNISPSNVSAYGNLSVTGSYVLGIKGNAIFTGEKYRFDYDLYYSSMPDKYWGIGYERGNDKDNYTKFTKHDLAIKLDFLKKLKKYTYIGISGWVQYVKGNSFDDISFLKGEDKSNASIGGGPIISYDSRDFIPNPSKGVYLMVRQNFFPKFLGSSTNFNRIDAILRYYKKGWKGSIIAFDFVGTFNNADTPWSLLALMGGNNEMRGYYKGRFRDKKLIETQVEVRQKVYGRSGVALWVGAGNAFPSFDEFEWDQTLPNFGIGYRWELKSRVNVRLDFGIGRGETGFYFSVNEAF